MGFNLQSVAFVALLSFPAVVVTPPATGGGVYATTDYVTSDYSE